MAKPTHSQTTARSSATAPARGRPEAQRKQIPQARRGSVTKPVKKGPPWMPIAISGGLIALAAVFVVVLVATRSDSSSTQTVSQRPAPVASPVPGTPAPDFKVTAKDGSVLTKADILGKPTMMIFFASWCPHCNNEAPLLKDLATKNPDVNFVAIGVFDRETADDIYNFQTKHDLPFKTYSDGGKAAAAYGIYSYPTLMAVDKTGTIRDVEEGEKTPDQLNAILAKAKG